MFSGDRRLQPRSPRPVCRNARAACRAPMRSRTALLQLLECRESRLVGLARTTRWSPVRPAPRTRRPSPAAEPPHAPTSCSKVVSSSCAIQAARRQPAALRAVLDLDARQVHHDDAPSGAAVISTNLCCRISRRPARTGRALMGCALCADTHRVKNSRRLPCRRSTSDAPETPHRATTGRSSRMTPQSGERGFALEVGDVVERSISPAIIVYATPCGRHVAAACDARRVHGTTYALTCSAFDYIRPTSSAIRGSPDSWQSYVKSAKFSRRSARRVERRTGNASSISVGAARAG